MSVEGNRARLVAWVGSTPLTTTYAYQLVEQVQVLQAKTGSNVTTYLHGVNPIGEFGSQSVYYLADGAGSVRQLANPSGFVVLSRWYEPFGQILTQKGTAVATYGYLGAQLDRVTGLVYVNGRYYDPVTGRFLTPSGGQNPYVPLPISASLLGPLMILSAAAQRNRKRRKWLQLLLVVLVLFAAGGMLVGCDPPPDDPQKEEQQRSWRSPKDPPPSRRTPTPSSVPVPPTSRPTPLPTPICAPTSTTMPVATRGPVSASGLVSPVDAPYMMGYRWHSSYPDGSLHLGIDYISGRDPDRDIITNQPGPGLAYKPDSRNPTRPASPDQHVTGREVYAIYGGTITSWDTGLNLSFIINGTEYQAQYNHIHPAVSQGASPTQGQVLGYYDDIGGANGIPHLDFNMRHKIGPNQWSEWENPAQYLP